ncbi:uncharacterized protein LOC114844346 isoform X1 [Betta splendens]|uniref:Uncharacterized protein LOC114844346 isoform X1 n=1 Tax=Betta splendens TaxID=158456 RepID=A0A9W2XDY2_BETSP|nr:uncharacterized protein LOC114844346 isoform X1 [Betta splendens]
MEEVGLRAKRSGTLRHREKMLQTETSLWEVMFWWLPDLDDDDDKEDEDVKVKRGCLLKKTSPSQRSSGLRNRPMLDKGLMKQKERNKDKRSKKAKDEAIVRKQREKKKEPEEAAEDKDTNGEDQNES